MGWPKKHEEARLYFERKPKTYLLVFPDLKCHDGSMEYVGELLIHNDPERPTLAHGSTSPQYLYTKTRRVEWSEMPAVWQEALAGSLEDKPEKVRGLWKINK